MEAAQRKRMTKLYVGNLTFGMTDESLMQLLVGKGYKVGSARIITDRETGRSRGFGFVELAPEDDAAKAISELNGLEVDGRALQVNEARPQEFRGGGGGGRDGSGGGRGGYSGGRPGRGGGGGGGGRRY
jgi:RNA recognition motif-containing protein